jgi:hypothetical protein
MPPRFAWRDTGRALPRDERRGVAAELLAGLLPGDTRLTRVCPDCGSPDHGPLTVSWASEHRREEPPLVSVSYTGSLVIVATAPATQLYLGIDAEVVTVAARRAAAEALPHGPGDPLQAWVRLEAAAKARRSGLGPRLMPDVAQGLHVDVTRVPGTGHDVLLAVAVGSPG